MACRCGVGGIGRNIAPFFLPSNQISKNGRLNLVNFVSVQSEDLGWKHELRFILAQHFPKPAGVATKLSPTPVLPSRFLSYRSVRSGSVKLLRCSGPASIFECGNLRPLTLTVAPRFLFHDADIHTLATEMEEGWHESRMWILHGSFPHRAPSGLKIMPSLVFPFISTTKGAGNCKWRTQPCSSTAGWAASHCQSTKPSPTSGLTVK